MDNVLANKEITSALAESEIRDIFSYERLSRNVDFIYGDAEFYSQGA